MLLWLFGSLAIVSFLSQGSYSALLSPLLRWWLRLQQWPDQLSGNNFTYKLMWRLVKFKVELLWKHLTWSSLYTCLSAQTPSETALTLLIHFIYKFLFFFSSYNENFFFPSCSWLTYTHLISAELLVLCFDHLLKIVLKGQVAVGRQEDVWVGGCWIHSCSWKPDQPSLRPDRHLG